MHYTASKSRTRGRIYLKHSTKKDSVTKEGEGNLGNELRARGGISHKWFVKKTYAGRKHSFFQRVNILWSIWCLVKGLIDVYVSSILHCLWCLFCLLKKHWFFHLTHILWTQGSLWDSKNFTRSNNFVSCIFAVEPKEACETPKFHKE